jgi:hypothetical protein
VLLIPSPGKKPDLRNFREPIAPLPKLLEQRTNEYSLEIPFARPFHATYKSEVFGPGNYRATETVTASTREEKKKRKKERKKEKPFLPCKRLHQGTAEKRVTQSINASEEENNCSAQT